MMKIDMHVHSKYSHDSNSKPQDLFRIAEKKGINFCITDHDVFRAYGEFKELMKNSKIFVVPGQEVRVFSGKEYIGELLLYFINEGIKPGQVDRVLDKAREQDALVSIAHPYDGTRKPYVSGFKGIEEVAKKTDGIEVFNSHCLTNLPNRLARELAEKHGLAKTAGSDSHLPNELGRGYVKVFGESIEDFRKAFEKKNIIPEGRLAPRINKITSPLINRLGKIIGK